MKTARLILPIVFIFISVIGAAFFILPRYQDLAEVRDDIKEREERVEEGDRTLAQLREFRRLVEAHEEQFEKLEKAVPRQTALPAVYHSLQEISIVSGVVLLSVSDTSEDVQRKDFVIENTTISFEVMGPYEGMKSFLQQIKNSPRVFNVVSVDMAVTEKELPTLRMRGDLEVYTLKQIL